MVDYPRLPDGVIDWYYPEYGKGLDKSISDIVTHLPGVDQAIQFKAMGMAREASMALLAHRHKGRANITVGRHPNADARTMDWYVYLNDDDPGGEGIADLKGNIHQRSAISIEFGWNTKSGKRVDGLHILGGVMKRAAGKYRGPK